MKCPMDAVSDPQPADQLPSVKSASAVVQEFKEDFIDAVEHMNALVAE